MSLIRLRECSSGFVFSSGARQNVPSLTLRCQINVALLPLFPHLCGPYLNGSQNSLRQSTLIFNLKTAPFTLSTLGKTLSRRYLEMFFSYCPENRIRQFMHLFPVETICMKCQILFSGKNKKISLICRLLN